MCTCYVLVKGELVQVPIHGVSETLLLSVLEVWGSIPGPIKFDTLSPLLRCFFVAVQALSHGNGPLFRYFEMRKFDSNSLSKLFEEPNLGVKVMSL